MIGLFDLVNYALLLVGLIVIVFPLLFTVSASVSDPLAVAAGKVWFLPQGFTLTAYQNVLANREIWTGYGNSIIYTVVGTTLNVAVTISCAFVLSRPKLRGKNLLMGIFVFTMYFHGGLIPTFILMRDLGLIDT